MQILNKTANMRTDMCYFVSSQSKVCDIDIETLKHYISVFEEIKKEEKSVLSVNDLVHSKENVIKNQLVRVKKMEEQKRAGYVLISGITCVGFIALGLLIFLTIKFMVIK